MKHLIKLLLLSVCLFLNTACFFHSTNSTEVGVRTKKISFFTKAGVEKTVYQPGATYVFPPIIYDWHTFDTKIQNLVMSLPGGKEGSRTQDDLKFKTIDGNDISLDVIVSYRILPSKAPFILEYVAQNDSELRDKIIRSVARSIPRDIFGQLETESFYTSEMRAKKANEAKDILNEILNPLGIVVEGVLTQDYRFNTAYQKAIEDKKIADAKIEQNKSATKAKIEEYNRKVEQAKGEVNRMIANADGEFLKAKIEADAYYQQQQQIAKAISAEAKAEAAGIRALNNALAEKGGKVMVKLEVAKALKGKKIIVLPTNSGNGVNLQTMDMNELLKLKGIQSVTPAKETKTK